MRFAGKTALITGASSGIGLAVARALGEEGANLALNDLHEQPGAQAVSDQVRGCGRLAKAYCLDVSEERSVDTMIADVTRQFGALDLVVTCAAHSARGPLHELNMDAVKRTVDVTMWGTFFILRAASREMIRQGKGGSIVVVSSVNASLALRHSGPYNMAKAAIDQLARTSALELAPHKIRVNIVHPGWTDTPGERKFLDEKGIATAGARLPLKRLAKPEEIARVILFLLDAQSEYITGSTYVIDGGTSLPWER